MPSLPGTYVPHGLKHITGKCLIFNFKVLIQFLNNNSSRQGVALQCLGRHGEALAAFSQGLAQDPSSQQLLGGLIEASIKSPLRHNLEPTFQQLEVMKLNQSPFVLISVVGQVGYYYT